MGFYGAILSIVSVVPYIGPALGFIGWIFLLLSYYNMSKEFKKPEIWKNYLCSFIIPLVGIVIAIIVGIVKGLSLLKLLELKSIESIGALISILIIPLLIAYISIVIGSYFYKRTLEFVAEATGEKNFKTAGTLFFVGGILLIILIGGLLGFLGNIFLILAFNNLRKSAKS